MQQLTIVSKLLQVLGYSLVKLACLSDEHLLDRKKVPVFPDSLQQIVKEVVKFES